MTANMSFLSYNYEEMELYKKFGLTSECENFENMFFDRRQYSTKIKGKGNKIKQNRQFNASKFKMESKITWVKEGKSQEMAQSERNSDSKNRGGKKLK